MPIKDVKLSENENNTEIEIVPFNFIIKFDENKVMIKVKGNTKMDVDGDFYLGVNGEFGIMSNNNPVHVDSLNSNIYLNSRRSKILKDLPESIEYIKKIENLKENNKTEELHNDLFERIVSIEKEIENLKCQMQQD